MRAFVLAVVCASVSAAEPSWPQFGGPTRDFKVSGAGIAKSWPSGGPKTLWSRELGEGYSGIVSDGRVLVTMYRPLKSLVATVVSKFVAVEPDPEVVVALDPATGRTLWEHRYPAPTDGLNLQYGPGPHSTPLLAGDVVIAAGSTGKLHGLDLRTGRVLWAHDLWGELHGQKSDRGYAPSPLFHDGVVLVPLGGPGQALAGFAPRDGKLLFSGGTLDLSAASPFVADVGGQQQVILFNANGVAGLDPKTATVLWKHPHKTEGGLNISTPVIGPDGRLFISSAYGSGSRVLELTLRGAHTMVKEVAFSGRMKLHFGNAIRIGDTVYGSSGDFGPAFFSAMDVTSGKLLWQERGFARASFLLADELFVILDEDGTLLLAEPRPDRLEIKGRVGVLSHRAWTAPTLLGRRLYLRDRKVIKALDLS